MNESTVAIVVAVIMALPGVTALLRQLAKDRSEAKRKELTEGVQAAVSAASALTTYIEQVRELSTKVTELEGQVGDLRVKLQERDELIQTLLRGIDQLCHQIKARLEEPVWSPPKPNQAVQP